MASVADDLGLSTETMALMKKLGMLNSSNSEEDDLDDEDQLKIFYCSRTHSQLTQFANEVRKIKLPPAIPPNPPEQASNGDQKHAEVVEEIKYLTLGSRKNLCINPKVSRLNASAINERCLELQEPKTPKDHRCPYLPTKETLPLTNDFRDYSLAQIRDIEDLGKLGKKLEVCPYYASRKAVKQTEVRL
jgi:chromosome transmission fidelity protein 1